MPGPAIRLLAVLELLQARGRLTGAELAHRLSVNGRTVRRYMVMLEELGIPLTAERGRDGAYLLACGFKLPPMMFTNDEALALAVGLVAARGLGAGAASAISSAQAKLERVMPEKLKRRLRAVDETVALELSRGRSATPGDSAWLAALSDAAQRRQRVRLAYHSSAGAQTERDFDPYGLTFRGGRWYAVGMCHLRGGVRSFRLDRVGSVEPRELHFERPTGFSALDHLTASLAALPRAHAITVFLKTTLETARRALFPAAGILQPTEEGVLLHSQADDLSWFARELSRLPFAFEIQRPAALVKALAVHARRLLASAERGAA